MTPMEQQHAEVEAPRPANPDELEHVEGRQRENLEGWIPALASDAEVKEALEKAFDYRGDVTLTLKSGEVVEGYLYDRRSEPTLEASVARIIPTPKPGASVERRMIAYSEIAALQFSGRDTAAGKSFDAWVKKYWEKKAAGETNIQIAPESLD